MVTLAAAIMGVTNDKMRVITEDIGGAFGMKTPVYPEYPAVMVAAKKLGRDVTEREVRSALAEFEELWDELFPAEQARIVELWVQRIDVHPDRVDGHLHDQAPLEFRLRLEFLAERCGPGLDLGPIARCDHAARSGQTMFAGVAAGGVLALGCFWSRRTE